MYTKMDLFKRRMNIKNGPFAVEIGNLRHPRRLCEIAQQRRAFQVRHRKPHQAAPDAGKLLDSPRMAKTDPRERQHAATGNFGKGAALRRVPLPGKTEDHV